MREQQAAHGVLHCFTEDWDTAEGALALGYYVSFSGIISFKNAQDLRDVAARVPLDRLLIETDSPYLSPEPNRGKRNDCRNVKYVAQKIADIKEISLEEVAKKTYENAMRIFEI